MQALGKGSIAWWLKLLLDVLWWILLLIGAGVLLFTLISIASGRTGEIDVNLPVQFELEDGIYKVRSEQLRVESAEIQKAHGQLHFKNPGGGIIAAFVAWGLLQLAIGLVVLFQLRKLFAALAAKAPFEAANARRVRLIGIVILVGQALGGVMTLVFTGQLKDMFTTEGLALQPSPNFNLGLIIFALVLLVIAEVFRIGAEMKAEQDLTV